MKNLALLLLLSLSWIAAAQTAQPQNPSPQKTPNSQPDQTSPQHSGTPTKAAVKRVHMHLEGFELEKKSPSQMGVTQIGGGSRGGAGAVTLYAPHLGKVYTTTPTFYWAPISNVATFLFRLCNGNGEILYEKRVSAQSLQYPADTALEPGETYSWTVQPEVSLMGAAGTPAEFVVLGQTERKSLAAQLASGGSDPMTRANVFIDKRLWYDAIQACSDLIAQYPDNADFYEKRAEIYDQLLATQPLAQADFDKADQLRASRH
jgi:hypothetical protein